MSKKLVSTTTLTLLVLGGLILYIHAPQFHSRSATDKVQFQASRKALPAVVGALALFPATSSIPLPEIAHGDNSKKQVIFTFDGGSTVQSADAILATLAKHHVRGTFFLTGKMIETYPGLVKRIASGDNEIFNHTYDHPRLTTLSD